MGAISPAGKLWKLPICNWCSVFHWTLALNFKFKIINDFEWMGGKFCPETEDQNEVESTTTAVCKLSDKPFLDDHCSLNPALSSSNPYTWLKFCLCGFKVKKYSKKSPQIPGSSKRQNLNLTFTGNCSHTIYIVLDTTSNLEMIYSIWRMCVGCMQVLCYFIQGTWASMQLGI